ncbi:mechanosensitive ion channel family protein [Fulvimarina endophytica]|uniref:Mechanosensitive ion channel family protein n=1 Tax=Fulvimarina endophytica TaxID=2293836 RepID=A0A371X7E0_9HYPH|nr:mechanosensitive ion channel domain-containing protein [Fulvimarina endophytica]RFC65117.1 mechanosensitive ion channel family protein [Fulvimarina endophytica]
MDIERLDELWQQILLRGRMALDFFYQPSQMAQVGAVLVCLVLAFAADRLTRKPIEREARRIKGAPGLLRVVVAIRRRMGLLYFVVFLFLATLLDISAGGPRSEIVSIVFKLSLTLLVISVSSRLVRNRLLSRAITWIAWGIVALSILGLLGPLTVTLDAAAFYVGDNRISALMIIKSILILVITLWLASLVGRYLDGRVQKSEELTPTLRVLIGKFLKIGLILLSLTVSLAAVGVDLTALTVLSGAIGVGLGFGLQKVVSNFISGIIILLDRSIKPGDTISLDNTFGWIRELRARFVSVVTRDGKEYLIPNEDFITNKVINWSFSNDLVRVDVEFGVSYDSDPHHVIAVAKEATLSVERVVGHRGVVCWMTAFGSSSIDFIVRFWITDAPAGLVNVKGQVLLAIWDAFKAEGINIPFPHREIIMRTPVDLNVKDADFEILRKSRREPGEPREDAEPGKPGGAAGER